MAKKALLTVDGTYHKVKKGLFTLDSVYRKVKKAYLTVGGVYRPCWADGKPTFYGAVTPLSVSVSNAVQQNVASTANHLFRCGGYIGNSNCTDAVDIYNKALTKTSTTLPSKRRDGATATIGGKMLYAGGFVDGVGWLSDVVVFSDDATRTSATSLSAQSSTMSGASNANYAVFAGGGGSSAVSTVQAYDADLTRKSATSLSATASYVGGAGNKNYAYAFGGLSGSSYRNHARAYDNDLTSTALSNLSVARYAVGAGTVGTHVIAAGGCTKTGHSGFKNTVDAYDGNHTKSTLTSLTMANMVGVANLDGYCIITGAGMANYFDEDLVLHDLGVTAMHGQVFVGTVGSYYLSMGGYPTTSWSSEDNTVNAITV